MDWNTGILKKLILVLCQGYEERNEELAAPDIPEEVVGFKLVGVIPCSRFMLTVHRDGVALNLDESTARRWRRMGQALFGYDAADDVVEVVVSGMASSEISHLKAEIDLIASGA